MLRLTCSLLLCFLVSLSFGQQNNASFVKEHYTKREVYIPMRDGVQLFTVIYEPKNTRENYPILMIRTPYSVAPYGLSNYKFPLGPSIDYMYEGFVFVYQDVRGKYMSEGDFVANRPVSDDGGIDESTDTYDTIDWLVKNVKSNQKVGIWGVSSPGLYASMSLINSHPSLKAVSPQAPVTDWFLGDDRHHNGAFMLMGTFSFLSSFGKMRDSISTRHPGGFGAYHTSDTYDFYLKTGALKNFNKDYLHGQSVLWNEMMDHPNYDSYWEKRNYLKHITHIKPKVLVVGGWFDQEDLYGPLKTFSHINKIDSANSHLVMGPWYHGSWTRFAGDSLANLYFGTKTGVYYRNHIEMPFFKKYLKEEELSTIPPVQVFFTGANYWKTFNTWPLNTSLEKKLYLKEGGQLSFELPVSINDKVSYDSDPAKPVPYTNMRTILRGHKYMVEDQFFASKRPDVLVFETEVLDKDVVVAGNIVADLFISSTGTDADFIVKLIDVYPFDAKSEMSDYQLMVRGEVMRSKYRNSFSKPAPLQKDKVHQVKFDMQDAAHVFKKGHKIMVQIQSTWFPLVDRNPQQFMDIYQADDKDFQKQTHTIYLNRDYPSSLILPIIDEK